MPQPSASAPRPTVAWAAARERLRVPAVARAIRSLWPRRRLCSSRPGVSAEARVAASYSALQILWRPHCAFLSPGTVCSARPGVPSLEWRGSWRLAFLPASSLGGVMPRAPRLCSFNRTRAVLLEPWGGRCPLLALDVVVPSRPKTPIPRQRAGHPVCCRSGADGGSGSPGQRCEGQW